MSFNADSESLSDTQSIGQNFDGSNESSRKRKNQDEHIGARPKRQASMLAEIAEDECTAYGIYIANKIRNYTDAERAIAQHRISDVLYDIDVSKYNLDVGENKGRTMKTPEIDFCSSSPLFFSDRMQFDHGDFNSH